MLKWAVKRDIRTYDESKGKAEEEV